MLQDWTPVAFAAVIVVGALGAHFMQLVVKELLPLLRTIATERQQAVPQADMARIADTLAALDRRLERLETSYDRLEEERRFTYELLAGRPSAPPAARDS